MFCLTACSADVLRLNIWHLTWRCSAYMYFCVYLIHQSTLATFWNFPGYTPQQKTMDAATTILKNTCTTSFSFLIKVLFNYFLYTILGLPF